tara:strand:- start:9199 stop:11088 length:1890 start_codon:yes stop_codon:yes gene_type:complete
VRKDPTATIPEYEAPRQRLATAKPRAGSNVTPDGAVDNAPLAQQQSLAGANASGQDSQASVDTTGNPASSAGTPFRTHSPATPAESAVTARLGDRSNTPPRTRTSDRPIRSIASSSSSAANEQAAAAANATAARKRFQLPQDATQADLLRAFRDSPPAVKEQAMRQLVAAMSRSADTTDQPGALNRALTDSLDQLPELPAETRVPATTPPNRLAANSAAQNNTSQDAANGHLAQQTTQRDPESATQMPTKEVAATQVAATQVAATQEPAKQVAAKQVPAQQPAVAAESAPPQTSLAESKPAQSSNHVPVADESGAAQEPPVPANLEPAIVQAIPSSTAPAKDKVESQIRPASAARDATSDSMIAQAAITPAANEPAAIEPAQPTPTPTSPAPLDPAKLSDQELYDALLTRLSQGPASETEAERSRRLIMARHLMVLAGDPDRAVAEIDDMSDKEQEYLRHQLLGLWTIIDPEGHPVPARRFTTALPQLREATKYLAAATDSLEVRSLAFCTEIEAYGQIKTFPGNRFDPGQQVILYCEIENFTVSTVEKGFETHLQGSYDIFDSENRKIVSQLLPADKQVSSNYLRDYFIAYQMHLPKQLPKGSYRLQLTMEDVTGKKYGQASIPLEIK